MTNKFSISLFALLIIFAISFSTALIAAEKLSESKIQTNAFSFMCKDKIEQNIKEMEGIDNCYLNLEDKVATVTYNPDKIKIETIKDKIVSLGYDAEIVIANNSQADKDKKDNKKNN